MGWLLMSTVCGLVSLMFVRGIEGQTITRRPHNTAAKIGAPARMNCTVDLAADILEWREFIGGPPGQRIYLSSTEVISDNRFEVFKGASGEFDLGIKNTQSDLGGLYQCGLIVSDEKANVEFVAVTGTTCSSGTSGSVIEDTEVILTCEVSFYGYKAPTLEWYSDMSMLPTTIVPDESNPSRLTVTTNVTAKAEHDMKPFECRLRFAADAPPAAEPPSYTDSCTTQFTVEHSVTNVVIHPDPVEGGVVNVGVGDEINCTASGRPIPSYNWYSEDGSDIVVGHILQIKDFMAGSEHSYRCEATNRVQGQERKAQRNIKFFADYITTQMPPTTTAGWVIPVAVCVPLVILVAILIGVCCYLRKPDLILGSVYKKLTSGVLTAMHGKPGLPLLLLTMSSLIKGGMSQTVTTSPVNTAGLTGTSSRLNCTADLMGEKLAWQEYFTNPPTGARIFTTPDSYEPGMQSTYTVIPGSLGQYDLEIPNTAFDLAGKYRCFLPVADVGNIIEFVAVSKAVCARTPMTNSYREGSFISLSCSVDYSGYKAPTLEWRTAQGPVPSVVSYQTTPPYKTVIATANITALPQYDNTDIHCMVNFRQNLSDPVDTLAPPTYTDWCVQNFMVQYPVQGVEISPCPEDFEDEVVVIEVGDQLNCTAWGRPEPDYFWYGEGKDHGIVRAGQALVINEKMSGMHHVRCEATNMINGVTMKANMNVTFNAVYPNGYAVQGAGTPGWVIAISVIIPLLLIAIAVVVALMFYRRKHGMSMFCYGKMQKEPLPDSRPAAATRSNGQLHLDLGRTFPPPEGAQLQSPTRQAYPPPAPVSPAPRPDIYPTPQQRGAYPLGGHTPSISENSFDSQSQQGRSVIYNPGGGVPVFMPSGQAAPDPGAPLREVSKKKRRKSKGEQATPGQADIYGSTHSLSKINANSDTSDPTIGTGGATRDGQGGGGFGGPGQMGAGRGYYSANV